MIKPGVKNYVLLKGNNQNCTNIETKTSRSFAIQQKIEFSFILCDSLARKLKEDSERTTLFYSILENRFSPIRSDKRRFPSPEGAARDIDLSAATKCQPGNRQADKPTDCCDMETIFLSEGS